MPFAGLPLETDVSPGAWIAAGTDASEPAAVAIHRPGETSSSGGRPASCTRRNLPGERTTPGLLRGALPWIPGELRAGRLDNVGGPGVG